MSKATNEYSPEVRERAVRMVRNNGDQHDSRWSAIVSISAKIGCAPQTLNEWVKKVEVDSGRRSGMSVTRPPLPRSIAVCLMSGARISVVSRAAIRVP